MWYVGIFIIISSLPSLLDIQNYVHIPTIQFVREAEDIVKFQIASIV